MPLSSFRMDTHPFTVTFLPSKAVGLASTLSTSIHGEGEFGEVAHEETVVVRKSMQQNLILTNETFIFTSLFPIEI